MDRPALRRTLTAHVVFATAWILASGLAGSGNRDRLLAHAGETTTGVAFVMVSAVAVGAALSRRSEALDRDLLASMSAADRATAQLELLATASPAVVWTATVRGSPRVTYVSPNVADVLGLPARTFLDDPSAWTEHVHPDDAPDVLASLEQVRSSPSAGDARTVVELRFRHADGRWLWLRAVARLLRDGAGRPETVVGAAYDVTDQRLAEAALRRSEHRYRLLFEANPLPMWVADVASGRIQAANRAAVGLYGWRPDEPLPRHAADLVVGPGASAAWWRQGVTPTQHRRRDGTVIDVEVVANEVELDGRCAVLAMVQDVRERVAATRAVADHVRRLERSITGTVDAMSLLIELRDPYTAGHQRRVGELGAAIARELGLDDDVQRGLRIAGSLHDVGKVMVPAEILTRARRLTPAETALVRQHAQDGYEVLKSVEFPWPVAEVARQHHERLDGSGYPRGLVGDEILLEARIIAVADVVDAMTGHRPYRPALGLAAALAELEDGAGTRYDADVVAACLRVVRKGFTFDA